jgi:hypothetical protein
MSDENNITRRLGHTEGAGHEPGTSLGAPTPAERSDR